MVIEPKTRVRLQFYLDESPLALSTLPIKPLVGILWEIVTLTEFEE